MPLVVIDPGHGGSDPGAVNDSYQEKNYTLSIGLKVRDYLLANYQTNVLMTRTTDTTVSLASRTILANSNNATISVPFTSMPAAERGGKVTFITEPFRKKPSTRKTPFTAR